MKRLLHLQRDATGIALCGKRVKSWADQWLSLVTCTRCKVLAKKTGRL